MGAGVWFFQTVRFRVNESFCSFTWLFGLTHKDPHETGASSPPAAQMLGAPLMSSCQAQTLLSYLQFIGLHHRDLPAVFSFPLFLEVLVDKDGFPELDTEN